MLKITTSENGIRIDGGTENERACALAMSMWLADGHYAPFHASDLDDVDLANATILDSVKANLITVVGGSNHICATFVD